VTLRTSAVEFRPQGRHRGSGEAVTRHHGVTEAVDEHQTTPVVGGLVPPFGLGEPMIPPVHFAPKAIKAAFVGDLDVFHSHSLHDNDWTKGSWPSRQSIIKGIVKLGAI
jgi:hypothetical protein